jgi:DNA ligase-associated metallophosphoesterase
VSAAALQIRGEQLLLHPDRAVIWPRLRAAIVADTHFGKSSVFGRNGVAVPGGTDEADRARLTRLVANFEIRRLVVLGDFLHAPLEIDSEEARALDAWKALLPGVHVQVIAGNHDRGVTSGWRGSVDWVAHEVIEPPFRFVHDGSQPHSGPNEVGFSLSGHVHPVIALRGLRQRSARVPVFWLRESGLILPSFGQFTGGQIVTPGSAERVFAVSPETVVAFPGGYPAGGGSGT